MTDKQSNNAARQWGIKVLLSEGETIRRKLIADGIYDKTFRPYAADGYLYLPVSEQISGAELYDFARSPVREDLARHEQVGGLVILQDDDVSAAEKIL